MNQPNLSPFIWSVADLLRGDYKQSDYGKVILPFTVLRRLSNSIEQFAASPDLQKELINANISAFDAHTEMSSQALNSESVQQGLRDILLRPAKLYEALRGQV